MKFDINKPIDVSKLETLEELKSLAYDFLLQRDIFQNNLNIVNSEITKRQKEEEKVEEAEIVLN